MSLSRHLGRELGPDAVVCQPNPEPHRDRGPCVEFEIQEARQTIERIEQTTWGVKLVKVNGRRFAILPESTPENPLLTMDGRPTVRLSSE